MSLHCSTVFHCKFGDLLPFAQEECDGLPLRDCMGFSKFGKAVGSEPCLGSKINEIAQFHFKSGQRLNSLRKIFWPVEGRCLKKLRDQTIDACTGEQFNVPQRFVTRIAPLRNDGIRPSCGRAYRTNSIGSHTLDSWHQCIGPRTVRSEYKEAASLSSELCDCAEQECGLSTSGGTTKYSVRAHHALEECTLMIIEVRKAGKSRANLYPYLFVTHIVILTEAMCIWSQLLASRRNWEKCAPEAEASGAHSGSHS